jgi:hypothetical protein
VADRLLRDIPLTLAGAFWTAIAAAIIVLVYLIPFSVNLTTVIAGGSERGELRGNGEGGAN